MASLVIGAVGNVGDGPLGGMIGAVVGSLIDRTVAGSLQKSSPISQEGSRLQSLHLTSSAEGAPIPRAIGRQRISLQLIWATNFREIVAVTTTTTGGGKGGGGGGGGGGSGSTTTTYTYFCSFGLGLGEGRIRC